ncbi:inorganic triphosphatase [Paraglaciecola sp. 2405UD69-4]|uniref:CYTH domain-containing protein n=1 Tax=Paraglaciecola sp. 2405UD69-4 TaxID=3391836 RepID=UPI0039C9DA81
MEFEIELKLLTNNNARNILENKLLPTLGGKVTKQEVVLENYYFDTPKRLLRKFDMGLRIRVNNNECEQTLKTSGQSIGGLHKRPEFNVSLDNYDQEGAEVPNLSLFDPSAWPTDFDLVYAQQNLETMFATNFSRHIYLYENERSVIEIVSDMGKVSAANQSLPICEVELELKKGNVSELFQLAKKITSSIPTVLGVQSKAARGYGLADKVSKPTPILPPQSMNLLSTTEERILLLNQVLSHFQHYSSCFGFESSQLKIKDVEEISKSLSLLSDCLKNLFENTQFNGFLELYDESLQLISSWSSVTINMKVESGVSFELQEHISEFLTHSQTLAFQLELIQVMLEKSWVSSK